MDRNEVLGAETGASPFVIPKCSDGEIGIHEGLKIP